ncbi:MAG: J domain-containing protein [Rhizonema sp. NSF051]|nr:J domain-containing protein [Rhizonema sp. NSF051]
MLSDRFYKRGVKINEVFESLEALGGEPIGKIINAWEFSEAELKRRYYRLAKIYHPDVHGSNEQMVNLNHAYKNAQAIVKINQMVNEYTSKK